MLIILISFRIYYEASCLFFEGVNHFLEEGDDREMLRTGFFALSTLDADGGFGSSWTPTVIVASLSQVVEALVFVHH